MMRIRYFYGHRNRGLASIRARSHRPSCQRYKSANSNWSSINTISPVVGRFAIYFRLFGKRYAPVSAFHPWRCRCYTNGARISGRLDSDQRRARRTRQIGFVLVRAAKHALTTTSRARRRAATRCAALSDHGIDVLAWLPSSLHAGDMPPTSTT